MTEVRWRSHTDRHHRGRFVGAAEPKDTSGFQPPAWMAEGSCAAQWRKPDDWFDQPRTLTTANALMVCAACPVKALCIEFAVSNRITDGIWGGRTETELRGMVKARFPGHRARSVVPKPKRNRKKGAAA